MQIKKSRTLLKSSGLFIFFKTKKAKDFAYSSLMM